MNQVEPTSNLVAAAPASPRAIVRLTNVSKSYGTSRDLALHPTTLDIHEGEFFSLLGPSGSGKTTTLRLIGGFEAPNGGSIVLDGKDVTRQPAHLRDVNTVFQNYALFPHMTVAQNVTYPLIARQTPDRDQTRRVTEAIALVEMTGFESRLPHELSGGQRQRVALARALVGRPKVLLLDEPLGALDLRLRQQMQSVLTHLQREIGLTFVYVTHDHGEALAMSDRVAVMANGRISQIGTPREIYYRPANRFVAGFIGSANLLDGHVSQSGTEIVLPGLTLGLAAPALPGPASITFRTEAVRLVGTAPPATNTLTARIDEVTFQGEITELALSIGPSRMTARLASMEAQGLIAGQTTTIRIDPAAIVTLNG